MTFGQTWWGRRWVKTLESITATYPNSRLVRGRTLARKGAVRHVVVSSGQVTAQVDDHHVVLTLPSFTDAEWAAGIGALAGQIRHVAALLDGRMPEGIDETLGLFPRRGELTGRCTCRDKSDPCAHSAAVHYVLASMFDDDPFLLPAVRGRDRAALLAALRPSGVPIADLRAEGFHVAGDLASIVTHPHESADPAAFVRRLGPPPVGDPAAVTEAVKAAAARALLMARGDTPNPSPR
jgi:uncharacterized Zn finger protein